MKNLVILFMLLVSVFAEGQNITANLKSTQPLDVDSFIGVDEFKNLYAVKDNILLKITETKTFQFTDFLLGDLTSVDILNPLKLVLFYQDTNTTVILDNTLSEIKRINFNQIMNFRTIQFATTANDRNLWIYNLDKQQLEVYDYNRNTVLAESFPVSETILLQKSNYNFCWLQTETGLLKYNIYGSLMNDYKFSNVITFSEKNDNLVIATDLGINYLNAKGDINLPLDLPKFDVKQLYLNIENLYIYDGAILHHYQLKLPKN